MTANSLPITHTEQPFFKEKVKNIDIQVIQEKIYIFLIEIVKVWSPEDVLREFKRLFIENFDSVSLDSAPGIYRLLYLIDNEQDFHHTLKRCCYILVNNWENNRKYKHIQELVQIFIDYKSNKQQAKSYNQDNIYRIWLKRFIKSKDFQELKLFAFKNEDKTKIHWRNRYTSYLLVAQSVDNNNSPEQQEAARKASKQLKDKYKFELAMYIARSQSNNSGKTRYQNPSILGDELLRLIKAIVVKKGVFSYENIANIFLKQTKNQTFRNFKKSLQKYLIYSVRQQNFVETLNQQLLDRLLNWKSEYDEEIIDKDLLLRTCNRIIDYLTIENTQEPSPLFVLLLSQGHPLTLVIVLLKIILISPNSRSHLEARIAHLIHHYEQYSETECKWLINFIEIFSITFAIYAENVEYNLVKVEEKQHQHTCKSQFNPDAYRVFSQLKLDI
ncbi:hypothetical protein QUB80_04980 [Chlorogloeopsis sp. ULAP01]|uniref:hypothetical protein n=1 Tax=Chlorogloeopsis sp. ULAP01 TaxID=3056483 RepID=UPI0025AB2DCE|nr:hypothetical protein [Chlorogloeopsis sp. ULAP01]MDM9380052.1 hypothetical protein [Chlorogloeopsis sp. ULAP01]